MSEVTVTIPMWVFAWFLAAFAALLTLDAILAGLKLYERRLRNRLRPTTENGGDE